MKKWNLANWFLSAMMIASLVAVHQFAAQADGVGAGCPDRKVRANSPCQTTLTTCTGSTNCTKKTGETTAAGNFQCDVFANNKQCVGSGNFVACFTRCKCMATANGNNRVCVVNPNDCQNFTQESKQTADCGGGGGGGPLPEPT